MPFYGKRLYHQSRLRRQQNNQLYVFLIEVLINRHLLHHHYSENILGDYHNFYLALRISNHYLCLQLYDYHSTTFLLDNQR